MDRVISKPLECHRREIETMFLASLMEAKLDDTSSVMLRDKEQELFKKYMNFLKHIRENIWKMEQIWKGVQTT